MVGVDTATYVLGAVVFGQLAGVVVALLDSVPTEEMGVELLQEHLGVLIFVGFFSFKMVALVDVGQDVLLLHRYRADAGYSTCY